MEDSSQLANRTDAAFGENSFNIFGGGSEGDLDVEEIDDSSTVEQGGGIIDLEGSVEVDNDDVHESDNSVDSEVDERVDESTAAHICKNHSNIGDCLRDWAIVHNQPRSSVNEILDIFRKWTALPLPKDSRTLLKTSTTIGQEIRTVPGGEFWYKGIENKLNSYFQSKAPSTHIISIQLSIDGLPLHRGGPMQVWPILMKVEQMPDAPIMMIGMFCGPPKPESLEVFLRPLVEEGKQIHERGLHIGEEVRQLKIRAIIADSPARAFIKATTYFNGYHGCMRCTCVGVYVANKIIFDTVGAPLRTDTGFRARECPGHHQAWRTPLEELPDFDLVENVPTSDRLHTCDLGVTRQHLLNLIENKFRIIRLSFAAKQWITKFLTKVQLPSEIHRKLRGLNAIRFWKGTEFRTYLHYVSPVLMEEILSGEAYCHFLLYFCALTIFSSSFHRRHWEIAAGFLNSFVKKFGEIYGREHLSSNVHNLQHIAQDVYQYGPLDEFSTYCFENHLQLIKRSVRSGFRCGVQVAARAEERSAIEVASTSSNRRYPRFTTNGKGIFLSSDFVLRPLPRDEWFLTKGNG
uniref:Transposase domain-containing protein n=1 Tax=Anopheles stephensi TaxID=30069 RepID=A0A182YSD7_ANOST